MRDVSSMVETALAAYKSGKKSKAREMLTEVVDIAPHNEKGWLYLSLVVDSLDEQEICLENVLAINPHNVQAQKALTVILEKQGKPPKTFAAPPTPQIPPAPTPVPPTPTPAPAAPEDGMGPGWGDMLDATPDMDFADFAPTTPVASPPETTTPDSATANPSASATTAAEDTSWLDETPWQVDASDPAISGGGLDLGSGWPEAPPVAEDEAIPTSVEWGKEEASTPSYPDSGQVVDEPVSQEWDNWMSSMNLGSSEDAATSDSVASFGTTVPSEAPIETPTEIPVTSADPVSTTDTDADDGWSAMWSAGDGVDLEEESSPFTSPINDVTEAAIEEFATATDVDSLDDDLASLDEMPSSASALYDVDDEDDDDFFDLGFLDDAEHQAKSRAMQFFAQIPDEIQVGDQSGGGRAGVVILFLLNLLAVAGLVAQFIVN